MPVFALYSIKGGVGKTATAVNLSYLSAQSGYSTLLVDLDPQASASYYFRMRPRATFNRKKFLKGGKHLEHNIRGTDYIGLDAIPAHLSYRNFDLSLNKQKKSKTTLRTVLAPLTAEYHMIFLDCPPNLTLVSENIFRATDILLVPVIPTPLSILTLEKLLAFFEKKRMDSTPITPFFSMVERRKSIHHDVMAEWSNREPRFLQSHIPYQADVEKMGLHREPLPCYRPKSKASEAYTHLWQELDALTRQ